MRLVKDKPIHVKGKQVGIIKKNRTYVSNRSNKHWFRKYLGFGLSTSVLAELRKYDVTTIKLIYSRKDGNKEIWTTSVSTFYEHGVVYNDEGNDYQRILSKAYWTIIRRY
jgi:hypothetical protein